MDDQHAVVPPDGAGRRDSRIQVSRVRGRAVLGTVPQADDHAGNQLREIQTMRMTLPIVAMAIALLAPAAAPVDAHHAFSAEFDANRPVRLEGTVTKMDWVNPHSWIHIDVDRGGGKIEKWMIEGGTPNTLLRRGLRRTDLPAGTKIKVEGYQA